MNVIGPYKWWVNVVPLGNKPSPGSILIQIKVTVYGVNGPLCVNTLRPRQNGRRFADDTFKRIFFNENVRISITISLKFVPKGPINNIPALVQIMAWRRSGDKPLSEPMMVSLLMHIFVTRPQWVNSIYKWCIGGHIYTWTRWVNIIFVSTCHTMA